MKPSTLPAPAATGGAALEVDGLCVDLRTPSGTLRAVNGVGFSVRKGRTLALLGESGCGKSMTALSIVGLLDPTAEVTGGSVRVSGTDVLRLGQAGAESSPVPCCRSSSRTR
ncbi:Dipeptide/oligopeptide/nickel ABC transporter ATP-binding protein OS=Streptomyces antimycoticus OX=68175 GN=SSPO_011310 PE=3 SV=1 [Streptomyces antimycoticus]